MTVENLMFSLVLTAINIAFYHIGKRNGERDMFERLVVREVKKMMNQGEKK